MELHQKQQSKEKQTNDERKRFEQQISITQKTLHQLMVYKRNKLVRKYKQHLPLRLVGNLLRFVMSPLPYCRMRRDTLEVRRSGLFNDAWYLSQYPDLYLTTVDMLQHYMLHGAQEGRNPNPYFDSHYYFNENPDVKEIGLNPLLHFLRYGCNEGRKPNQSFDPKYYLENNLDVKAANMNPLFHYSHYGVTEGRKTSENNLEGNVEDKVDQENFLFHKQNLRESKKTNLKIVVVFHVYHTDIIGECLEYIKNIPFEYDLIVTTSLPQDNEDLKKLRDVYPELRIVFCENKGRDIGAFIKAWQFIQAYDICCKVHTKKGDSSYIKLWRNLSLSEILGNSKLIEQIIFEFECDPNIAIAGAELLYGSYNSLIGKNKTNCEYLRDEYSIPSNNFSDNGFFMGTMFWMRVEKYSFISNFENLRFSEETGLNEGSYEHAIERLLGSFSLQKNDKIILTRLFQNNLHSYKVLSADYQPAIKTFHAHFDLLSDSKKFTDKITGYIDNNDEYDRSIVGWLAMIGDEKPREAVIRINDELDVDIICSKYRIDLDSEGINKGNHGFRFLLPFKYADGSLYNLVLVDKFSGKVVDSIFIKKKHLSVLGIDRENSNWDIKREHEFHEKLNKCKALKGNCFSGLVSIIMPTYNRADIIGNAIQSALNQVYVNFELIIVDDDSTDDTECVVKKLIEKDERIKYKKIIKGGVSKARNTGLSLSMGKYIFYLDSDNEWVENYLRTMVDFLYYTELDSAYCGLEAIDDNNRTKHFIGNDFSWDELKYANYIDINSFGHIKKCDDLILFDESLKRFVDWDYILNFTKNHTVSYVPFLGVKYYDGTRSRISNNVYQESQELVEIISQIQIKYECILRSVSYDRISTSCKLNITNACENKYNRVSTIITSYNHEEYIADAIESVINQKGDFLHEIIISDDGSTDNTSKIVDSYAMKYPALIRNISQKHNVGISANMKHCISACNGDLIAICEGDDYWTNPYKLQKQIQFIENNSDCSMVFSKIEINNIETNSKSFLKRQEGITKNKLDGEDFINDPNLNLIANFSSCLFRADILKSLPIIIYTYRVNEIAIAFYFEQFGKIGFIDEVLSVYRQHANGVWTGSSLKDQLNSGLKTREILKEICASKYKSKIQEIINEKYLLPLKNMS